MRIGPVVRPQGLVGQVLATRIVRCAGSEKPIAEGDPVLALERRDQRQRPTHLKGLVQVARRRAPFGKPRQRSGQPAAGLPIRGERLDRTVPLAKPVRGLGEYRVRTQAPNIVAIACHRAFGGIEGVGPVAGSHRFASLGSRDPERPRIDARKALFQVCRERAIQGLWRDAEPRLNGGGRVLAVGERRQQPDQPV